MINFGTPEMTPSQLLDELKRLTDCDVVIEEDNDPGGYRGWTVGIAFLVSADDTLRIDGSGASLDKAILDALKYISADELARGVANRRTS